MKYSILALGVAALGATAAAVAVPAPARAITCDGQVQVNPNSRIVTPYCEDVYLARVARGYGMRVSAGAIRHNIYTKEKVCRFIGHDSRLSAICGGLDNTQNGGGRFQN